MQFFLEEIPVTITQKRMKNIYLRICQNSGEVKISASKRISILTIKNFAKSKISWIRKHQAQILINIENRKKQKQDFYLLGEKYLIKTVENQKKNLVLEDAPNQLTMHLKTGVKKEEILAKFCRKKFLEIVQGLAQKWQKIIGVNLNEVRVRQMKTRFGTCNIKEKRIWLSLILSNKSLDLIEYVVVHEIVHLLERRHNQKFKNHMTNFLPNWMELEKKLKNNA
jgi:predicted metal-dependent hydrolase